MLAANRLTTAILVMLGLVLLAHQSRGDDDDTTGPPLAADTLKITKAENVQNTRGLKVSSEWNVAGTTKIKYTLTVPGRGPNGKDYVETKEVTVVNPAKNTSTILLPDAQKGDKVRIVLQALDVNGAELKKTEKKDVELTK